jgi:hypothetical protein
VKSQADAIAMLGVGEEIGLGEKIARRRGEQGSQEPNPPTCNLEDRQCCIAQLKQPLTRA